MPSLRLATDPAANALLDENPFAVVIGMLLDQQIPMETAFAGPKKIADRMGGVDAGEIADYDPDKFAALCSRRPAVHRFPGSMAKRIQALAREIVDGYGGDAAALWTAGRSRCSRSISAAQGATRLRRAEVADLSGAVGQAVRRDPARLARGGR